ncbi:hypothetical protein ACSTKL_23480, partial [Vibrio parahaemolyticus]
VKQGQNEASKAKSDNGLPLLDEKNQTEALKLLREMRSGKSPHLPICSVAGPIMEQLDKDGKSYNIIRKHGPFEALSSSGLTVEERL